MHQPDQINAQVPSGVPAGSQQLIVTSSAGSSAAYGVDLNDVRPGLFAAEWLIAGGCQYISAVGPDGFRPIFTPGDVFSLFAGGLCPGDTISFYGKRDRLCGRSIRSNDTSTVSFGGGGGMGHGNAAFGEGGAGS